MWREPNGTRKRHYMETEKQEAQESDEDIIVSERRQVLTPTYQDDTVVGV